MSTPTSPGTETTSKRCPVFDFDHHRASNSTDRQSVLEEVRGNPVFYSENHGGFWVAASYATARTAFRDTEHFSTRRNDDGTGGVTIPTVIGPRLLPAEVDGEYHRKLKKVMLSKLDKRTVDLMRPQIEAVVTDAIDELIANGPAFDVVHDLAEVVPARIIVTYLGFPDKERLPFIKAVQDSVSMIPKLGVISPSGPTPEQQAAIQTFARASATITDLIAARRKAPQDDLISHWLAHENALTDDEVMWMTFTLILGGAENPAALIENALLHLDEDHDLRARLREDPSLIPAATEEFLRYVTAGISLTRNVIKDVELGGHQLSAGERVLIWLPAANRDPSAFADPDELDIERTGPPHIAFGSGPHMCPGSFLTRLEFRLVLEQVLERIPDYSIDAVASQRVEDSSLAYIFRTMPAKTGL
jgi:cytochrome P450